MNRVDGLVIVDMQPYFENSQKPRLIRNVVRLVKWAKESFLPIVVLQYKLANEWRDVDDEYEDTYPEIMKHLDRYPDCVTRWKYTDSGADQALKGFAELGLNVDHEHTLMVCGVNTNACVYSTISDLEYQTDCKIKVIAPACNGGYWKAYHSVGSSWSETLKHQFTWNHLKNVEVSRIRNRKLAA